MGFGLCFWLIYLDVVGDPTRAQPHLATEQEPNHGAAVAVETVYLPESVTALVLTGYYRGRTSAQGGASVAAYKGKWMRFSGPVVGVHGMGGRASVGAVTPEAEEPSTAFRSGWMPIAANLRFRGTDMATVRSYSIGHVVSEVGMLAHVDDQSIRSLDCELVGPAPVVPPT